MVFLMLERFFINRTPIINVLADRTIITASIAQKLEIKEPEKLIIEKLFVLLNHILQTLITLLFVELESLVSMVWR